MKSSDSVLGKKNIKYIALKFALKVYKKKYRNKWTKNRSISCRSLKIPFKSEAAKKKNLFAKKKFQLSLDDPFSGKIWNYFLLGILIFMIVDHENSKFTIKKNLRNSYLLTSFQLFDDVLMIKKKCDSLKYLDSWHVAKKSLEFEKLRCGKTVLAYVWAKSINLEGVVWIIVIMNVCSDKNKLKDKKETLDVDIRWFCYGISFQGFLNF